MLHRLGQRCVAAGGRRSWRADCVAAIGSSVAQGGGGDVSSLTAVGGSGGWEEKRWWKQKSGGFPAAGTAGLVAVAVAAAAGLVQSDGCSCSTRSGSVSLAGTGNCHCGGRRTLTTAERQTAAAGGFPAADWDSNWDLRAPKKASSVAVALGSSKDTKQTVLGSTSSSSGGGGGGSKRRVGTRYLVLIRHGQYVTRDPGLDRSVEDDPEEDFLKNDPLRCLTALGRKQADFVGRQLVQVLRASEMAQSGARLRVYCSDMSRAKETATIMHKHLRELQQGGDGKQRAAGAGDRGAELLVDSLLREGAPCPPAGYKGSWQPSPHEFYEEGGRIEAAFRKFMHRAPPGQEHDSVDVVVCHGNVIRYFLMRVLQLPPTAWLRWSLYNASVTRIAIRSNGSVSVRCVGDTMGQPPSEVTYH